MQFTNLLGVIGFSALASAVALPTGIPQATPQTLTSVYGSLGHGVYEHFIGPNGTMMYLYHGNPQSSNVTKRALDMTSAPDPYKKCNHQTLLPNKKDYGGWCETPNSKDPWKCTPNGQTIDPRELNSAYGVIRQALGEGVKWSKSTAISGTYGSAVAYVCKFGDSLTYSQEHFQWMMGQIDTQCRDPYGASYYDGKKYAIGRTIITDTCNCAFTGTGGCRKR